MKLFDEDGKQLGLYDICRWWIETYPEDVFITAPVVIVQIREHMENILKFNKSSQKEICWKNEKAT